MHSVLLLKEKKSLQDDYETLLTLNGFQVEFMQVLKTEFINQNQVFGLFSTQPNHTCAGLIVTSQNAGRALDFASIHPDWLLNVPVFCVGEATGKRMEKLGFKTCLGQECGNAKALAEFIINQNIMGRIDAAQEGHYLFLTGDKTKAVLPDTLQEASLKVVQVQVYQTVNIEDIDSEVLNGKINVIFSPSGLAKIDFSLIESCQWIAIGPTTRKALEDCGINCFQAKAPTPKGLLEAIRELQNYNDGNQS